MTQEFFIDVWKLADDDLYELFAYSDDHNDRETALAANMEITRRARYRITVVGYPPGWIFFLPRSWWHARPPLPCSPSVYGDAPAVRPNLWRRLWDLISGGRHE